MLRGDNPKVLVIDDQWGQPTTTMVEDTYGMLPFRFVLESSQDIDGFFRAGRTIERVEKEKEGLAIVLLDIMFGKKNDRLGVEILEKLREKYPVLPILMLTSVEDPETVIKCMELGANEYIVKLPSAEQMGRILQIYTEPRSDDAIYGNSNPIRGLRAQIARITSAPNPSAAVLIVGESGTGKELVARAIWRQGRGMSSPFVAKNCAHAASNLLDDELFGHERGAFTGAEGQRIGLLEEADEGVLFLDEIGSMPLELQGKLLRVLETKKLRRLGGTKDIETDFQLIAATNRMPEGLLKEGLLREDFFYRLNQVELYVPPLREHIEDLPIYIELFVKKFIASGGASYRGRRFSDEATECLRNYSWPGNIRELKNLIDGSLIMSRQETIELRDLPEKVKGKAKAKNNVNAKFLPENRDKWARHLVLSQLRIVAQALELSGGNATVAAKHLFPFINSPNATYIKRFIKRIQEAPWGYNDPEDKEMRDLLEQVNRHTRKGKAV